MMYIMPSSSLNEDEKISELQHFRSEQMDRETNSTPQMLRFNDVNSVVISQVQWHICDLNFLVYNMWVIAACFLWLFFRLSYLIFVKR